MSATGFRTLAEQLRDWPDERLAQLLRSRADLATPAPQDCAQLAARAATRSSLTRALDGLDRCELTVLDALSSADQTSLDELTGIVHADPSSVRTAVERLVDLALAWRSTGGLRAVGAVAEALGSTLGPYLRLEVNGLSDAATALLRHVLANGGQAQVGSSRTRVSPAEASTPAEELFAHGLLVPRADRTCVATADAALLINGGHTTLDPVDVPPELVTGERSATLVDRTAAGAAFEAVRRVELLLEGWGQHPAPALRSGGLGVRELRATAARLGVAEPVAALLIEVAVAAGLAAAGTDREGNPAWMPTTAFDAWVEEPAARRWLVLARAWHQMPRMPGLVGSRDAAGKAWNALAPELSGVHMADTRARTLAALSTITPGRVLAAGTGAPSLLALLGWQRPRRPRTVGEQMAWTLSEAAELGISGLGGLASYSRAWLSGEDPLPALEELLPAPVDHVLLQADLTAVAPGPLESEAARRLASVAEVESRGGATVYRFTPASIRRAMDIGWSAIELHTYLDSVASTPVPQPLTYLIDDVARTHGSIRVGYAEAYLRADDEDTLTEVLHRAPGLGLRRIAPTVLISQTPIEDLLKSLRELGVAPVAESSDGVVHLGRPDTLRVRVSRRHGADQETTREVARASAAVTAIRAGDAVAKTRPGATLSPAGALAALREAIDARARVVIGYVDNQGVAADRLITPEAIVAGQLTAFDHRAEEQRTFSVARIRTVRPTA